MRILSTAFVVSCFGLAVGALSVRTASAQCNTDYLIDTVEPLAPEVQDSFGEFVAISGSRLVVTARQGFWPKGGAYVFENGPSGWAQSAILQSPTTDTFGSSISIEGDVIAVGTSNGAFLVFEFSSGSWGLVATIQVEPPTHYYPINVVIEGGRILVGSSQAGGGQPAAGAGYLYEKISGVWTATAAFSAGLGGPSASYFGRQLALDGDIAVFNSDAGAHIFEDAGNEWVKTATVASESPYVAVDGGRVFTSDKQPGSILVFGKVGPFWVPSSTIQWPEADGFSTFVVDGGKVLALARESAYRMEEMVGGWSVTHEYEGAAIGLTHKQGAFSAGLTANDAVIGVYDASATTGIVGIYRTNNPLSPPEYGQGCAGSAGIIPAICVTGVTGELGEPEAQPIWDACFQPGADLIFGIEDALGGAMAVLAIGPVPASVSVGGVCTLLVGGGPILWPIPVGGNGPGMGSIQFFGSIPPTAATGKQYMQAFVVDPGAPTGISSTAAIRITTQ